MNDHMQPAATPQSTDPIQIANGVIMLANCVRTLVQHAEADTSTNGVPIAPNMGPAKKQFVRSVLAASFVDHPDLFEDLWPAVSVYIDNHVTFQNAAGRFRHSAPPVPAPSPDPSALTEATPAQLRRVRGQNPPRVAANGETL